MPAAITVTFNQEEGRYSSWLSEVCHKSPFLPVQIGLVLKGQGAVIFCHKERVKDEEGNLLHVDYQSEGGLLLRVVNDLSTKSGNALEEQ